MESHAIIAKTRDLLDQVGQLKSPTPRLGAPKVQGWILGWIAGHAAEGPLDLVTLLDIPAVHEALQGVFEGMSNPFNTFGGSIGYTALVEAQRILKAHAAGETLAELDEMKLQWVAIGHAEARAALDSGARPERFMAIFGR